MSKWLNRFQPWGILCMRLVLGAAMLYHGFAKLVPRGVLHGNNSITAFSHFVATHGLHYWLGNVSGLAEFIGGILLILGLFTRFAAFIIAIDLVTALILVNIHHGYSGCEYTLALAALALMLLFSGHGIFALDRRIGFA